MSQKCVSFTSVVHSGVLTWGFTNYLTINQVNNKNLKNLVTKRTKPRNNSNRDIEDSFLSEMPPMYDRSFQESWFVITYLKIEEIRLID